MVASATYNATGGNAPVVHYRESATDDWSVIDPAAGGGPGGDTALSATLRADFSAGTVGGSINTPNSLTNITGNVGTIYLRDGSIDGEGKFGGSAEAQHSKRQTGSWTGEFFGDTTVIVPAAGQTPRTIVPSVPAHAAATFSVTRPKIGTDQDSLTIRGAFGAPDS